MILILYLALLGAACLTSFVNWRWGLYFMVLAGVLEDPVRKVTPGAPAYLTLTSVAVYLCTLAGMFSQIPDAVARFRAADRRIHSAIIVLLFALIPGGIISATYGAGSWLVTVVGVMSYGTAALSLALGYMHPANVTELRRFLGFYCLVTSIMMVGTPLEYSGVKDPWGLLGTSSLGTEWIRQQTGFTVNLIAGFYRSPDIMAWHAATLAMLSIGLALSGRGAISAIWYATATWGTVCTMISGRRKAFWMIPIFLCILSLLYVFHRGGKVRTLFFVAIATGAVAYMGYTAYQRLGRSDEVEQYYFGNISGMLQSSRNHSYGAILETYRQSGFFGKGLGVATPGTQHLIGSSKPVTWQEEGGSRILVEVGVIGMVAVIWLTIQCLRTALRIIMRCNRSTPEWSLIAGLFAMVLAHSIAFQVSHLVYGTPFVGILLPTLFGFVLAGRRMISPRESTQALRHVPSVQSPPEGVGPGRFLRRAPRLGARRR